MMLPLFATLLFIPPSKAGGGFPPKIEGVTVIRSNVHKNVTISFKEPGICETTPGVKSYAGYVHLPPGLMNDQPYPINTFFWFFEARNNPENAPLAIWLNGGAGVSSMTGLLEELGPCTIDSDSATTIPNTFSWNNNVNMLFIDQPNQVGFSYDIPTNGTQMPRDDGFGFNVIPGDGDFGGKDNLTVHAGSFSSQKQYNTANSTDAAALAMWHFLQVWLFEFPPYLKSSNDRVSLWTESYGGHYGPTFARFFHEQNDAISPGHSPLFHQARRINLDTLGIVSGMIDVSVQFETAIDYAYNNSYDLPLINKTQHSSLLHEWSRPGGCSDLLSSCQRALSRLHSNISTACPLANRACTQIATSTTSNGFYDLTHPRADPFPPPHLYGYLRRESVLRALGVPVNYSSISVAVGEAFVSTYDWLRGGDLENIGYLLDRGVSVHLLYGDRDPATEWRGGEKASLAVRYKREKEFRTAGYAPLVTEGREREKGMTRQLGRFSFTRVFQAGHELPAYQPEAALAVFERAMEGRDVATGKVDVWEGYVTVGPRDVWGVKMEVGEVPRERCYVLKPMTCRNEVWERVLKGEVKVRDWYLVEEGEVEDGSESMGDL